MTSYFIGGPIFIRAALKLDPTTPAAAGPTSFLGFYLKLFTELMILSANDFPQVCKIINCPDKCSQSG